MFDSVTEHSTLIPSASICMATYNGERHLSEQVDSILIQLGVNDELVVVDDASSDGTVALLEGIDDPRIRVFRNLTNIGHVQSFARALSLAKSRYILMADQDDIWIEGRLLAMREALETGFALVSTNSKFIDREGRMIPPLHPDLAEFDSSRYATNILRVFLGTAYYDGCTMGFRDELRELILPIPPYVESHDLWIAMCGNVARSNLHLERYTLRRRVHGGNASVVNRSFIRKLWSRIIFLLSFFHIVLRLIVRKNGQKN